MKPHSPPAPRFPRVATVRIDESQMPEAVAADLAAGLKHRRWNHKFHYDSVKQAVKWLDLHEKYSPFRNDPACRLTYDRAFGNLASLVQARSLHVTGLGCGSGEKDIRLVQILRQGGRNVEFTPTDVSVPLALMAWKRAWQKLVHGVHSPAVFDLLTVKNLRPWIRPAGMASVPQAVTFFGLIPNFEPDDIFGKLSTCLRRRDYLIASANLLPEAEDEAGLKQVLEQYDNALTKEWLSLTLFDLGITRRDGCIRFRVRRLSRGKGVVRFEARFHFARECQVRLPAQCFKFSPGAQMRLFFSDRHTPRSLSDALTRSGLALDRQWIIPSGEEGVFLIRKK